MNFTKTSKRSIYFKSLSSLVLMLVIFSTYFALNYALKLRTEYSPKQFQPKKHLLLAADQNVHKLFQLEEASTHLLVLSLPKQQSWLNDEHFQKLSELTKSLEKVAGVQRVVSLANVESALVDQDSFYVGKVSELFENEKE